MDVESRVKSCRPKGVDGSAFVEAVVAVLVCSVSGRMV